MIVAAVEREEIIGLLKEYARSLGGRVTRNVGNHIARVYGMMKDQTKDSARFFECSENELSYLLPEYLGALAGRENLLLCVYLGRQVSYRCKSSAEEALSDASELFIFPTNKDDKKIRVCVMFFKQGAVSTEGIDDSATELLRYHYY